jgi:hypothetical protein
MQTTADARQRYFARIILFLNVYFVQPAELLDVTRVHSDPEASVYWSVGLSSIVLFDTASIVLAAFAHPPHVRIRRSKLAFASLTLRRRLSKL